MAKKAAVQQGDPQPPSTTNAAAADAKPPTLLTVKLDDITWTRDRFVSGLLKLEMGVRELRVAYLNHFNTLLPEDHPARVDPNFLFAGGASSFGDVTQIPGLNMAAAAAAAGALPGQKRKRKPHDPKAPKRALTSYFLFMQANKPKIKETNPKWTAQQVSEESEKRWATIGKDEKSRYEWMYNVDLARYYKQKEEYDAGRGIPAITPDEAQALYKEHLRTGTLIKGRKGRKVIETAVAAGEIVPSEAATAVVEEASDEEEADDAKVEPADEDAEGDDDEDEEEDESEEEAPPPKAKKAKTSKSTPAKSTPKKAESPEKTKKARGKKAAEESENSAAEEPTPAEKGKKKPASRKPRKSAKSD